MYMSKYVLSRLILLQCRQKSIPFLFHILTQTSLYEEQSLTEDEMFNLQSCLRDSRLLAIFDQFNETHDLEDLVDSLIILASIAELEMEEEEERSCVVQAQQLAPEYSINSQDFLGEHSHEFVDDVSLSDMEVDDSLMREPIVDGGVSVDLLMSIMQVLDFNEQECTELQLAVETEDANLMEALRQYHTSKDRESLEVAFPDHHLPKTSGQEEDWPGQRAD